MKTPFSYKIETAPPPDTQKMSCSVCCREIPVSAAFTPEGIDYVGTFCGIECFEEFVAQRKEGQGE